MNLLLLAGLACCCLVLAPSRARAMYRTDKPDPEQALALLKQGNERFVNNQSIHPNTDTARLIQAGSEDQADHAMATILTCSDSRMPVERIFDAGVMDLFVVRVAGNVVSRTQAGSIEYGLATVRTPVLVVLGHTQCGAVIEVLNAVEGRGRPLEINIQPLVRGIMPAVERAKAEHPDLSNADMLCRCVEENVWQGVKDLFLRSPTARDLVRDGAVKVVGAIYDVGRGSVDWLPEGRILEILEAAEADPARETRKMAD